MNALPRDWAALGARVNKWTPPDGAFEPAGAWALEYSRHSLIPSPDGATGGGVAGALSVRRVAADGAVSLAVTESAVAGFTTMTTTAQIRCVPGALLTPSRWRLVIQWEAPPPARVEPGELDQERSGLVEGGEIVFAGTKKRRIPAPARWTSFWSLFAVIPALPFEAGAPLEFDLLEDLELLKPGQRLAYVGRHDVEVAGRAMKLHVFEQTGRGVMPWRWWLDDSHRIVLAAGGRRAYLAGTPATKGGAA
jgi:hypothetical protein